MSESLYLLTICLVLGTILIVFAMRYFAALLQAKSRLASEDAYRRLSETAVLGQTAVATALAALQVTLGEIGSRLASVEKVLKDVE